MKKNQKLSCIYIYIIMLVCVLFSGCATVKEPKTLPVKDLDTRLNIIKKEREAYLRLLDKTTDVDDVVTIQSNLKIIQSQIENNEKLLKDKKDEADGFETTTERTVVYGPIGWVLVGSKWILDKLFIVYPWNWRAF
jgi:hypothetical protein